MVGTLNRHPPLPPDPPDLSQFPPLPPIVSSSSSAPSTPSSQTAHFVGPVNGAFASSASSVTTSSEVSLSSQVSIPQNMDLDPPSSTDLIMEANPRSGTVHQSTVPTGSMGSIKPSSPQLVVNGSQNAGLIPPAVIFQPPSTKEPTPITYTIDDFIQVEFGKSLPQVNVAPLGPGLLPNPSDDVTPKGIYLPPQAPGQKG